MDKLLKYKLYIKMNKLWESYELLLILSNMDEYNISDIPSRFLNAQHFQSSMDQPNLDNV
jgi:hypothetical protein